MWSLLKLRCPTLLVSLISYLLYNSEDTKYEKGVQLEPPEYDVIIVGAGSAGCVLANRLTEINEWNVLLLEAGGEESEFSDIPGNAFIIQGSSINWHYRTQPAENSCLLLKGCDYACGKVLGGSSTLNHLLYVRGNSEDYNNWAELGNLGWNYKDVLPYFKKSEDNKDEDILNKNPKYHQSGGYQSVERFPYTTPHAKILLRGLDELGLKNVDVNAESQLGSMKLQTTSSNGSRASTNKAFLRPIIGKRSNLFIKTRTFVTKILIDPSTKKAIGVEYDNTLTGKSERVMAKKEVIVSAGIVGSPKLLMLSGIGPIDELQKHGINVIKNLSVGHNLQDHVSFLGLLIEVGDRKVLSCTQELEDLKNYLSTHRGPLSTTGVTAVGAFFQTESEKSQSAPDIQLHFLSKIAGFDYLKQIAILPTLLNPKSIGFIKLNDTDSIRGAPLIQPRFFSELSDVKVMLQAVRKVLGLFNTTVFKENNFKLNEIPLPPCAEFKFNSDEYWTCLMAYYTHTVYHPVGTCKMGPKEDSEAVVDPELRVHGITNLRVIDASIMPKIIRGNPNAPTIMIAEKGSDMIKTKYGVFT